MPTPTYIPLATKTLTSTTSTVTFSSITSSFKDLVLVVSATSSSSTSQVRIRVNGDTGTNYANISMEGTGTAAQSAQTAATSSMNVNYNNGALSTNERGPTIIHFMDYRSNKYKIVLARGNGVPASTSTALNAYRWTSTSGISSISLLADTTFAVNSVFTLFGIAG